VKEEAILSTPETADRRQIVECLARALDADDFPAVRALLAEDCVYELRGETLTGAADIVTAYADASSRARRDFDDVRYESEVLEVEGENATVQFTDYLGVAGGHWHRHRCRQRFTVGPGARIVRIVHVDLPGEREALAEFLRVAGVRG
jgi:hypothetical protein